MAHDVPLVNDGNVVEPILSRPQQLSNDLPKSAEARSSVLHRSLHSEPVRVQSAKGNYLYLSNGQKIFDATGGAAVSCLGHGDER